MRHIREGLGGKVNGTQKNKLHIVPRHAPFHRRAVARELKRRLSDTSWNLVSGTRMRI